MKALLVDVGAGTMDVLWVDDASGVQAKAVVVSPVRTIAKTIEDTPGNLLVTGGEMGGGPVTRALVERAKTHRVVMTASAAATVHHDPERVRAKGIEILEPDDADREPYSGWDWGRVRLADLEPGRLERLSDALGVDTEVDVIACCVQDHGVPPTGGSHVEHRAKIFSEALARRPDPLLFLYRAEEIPETFNRLRSVAGDAARLGPRAEVFVMDSGMAAIAGARLDPRVGRGRRAVVLDVATSHTVGAAFEGEELRGRFEFHTQDLTVERLDELVDELIEGRLDVDRVLAEGGHGGWQAGPLDGPPEIVLSTGPKRDRLARSRHPLVLGAPLGDNMMTGTAGLLEAVRQRRSR